MAFVCLNRLETIARFGNDVQVGFLVDDVGDTRSKQGVIVNQQHACTRADARTPRQLATWTCVGSDEGSQASTTSVPLRGAVTIVSEAPIRSARSCIPVIPNPDADGSRAIPRPSSATDTRSPTDCTRGCSNRDALRARVTHGVRERLLRDRDDLAFDPVAEAGQFVDKQCDRHFGVRCPRSASRLRAEAMSSPFPTVRTQGADRSACLRQMCARQFDSRFDTCRQRSA